MINLKDIGLKEHTYFFKGMHCASCELIIEKKLLKEQGVEAVDAFTNRGEVRIEYVVKEPDVKRLNQLFKNEKYMFSNNPFKEETSSSWDVKTILMVAGVSLLFIVAFDFLNKTGLSGLSIVNSTASLPAFFVFGLLAGISSCAALIGGLVLSMAKQWSDLYSGEKSLVARFQPHFLFNSGRLVSYFALGAVLGAIGSAFKMTSFFSSILVFGVSILMILLGLQMLGVKALRRFWPIMPKSITRFVADESHFKRGYMPFLMGALTFFLPCGFTITSQGLAIASGNPIRGALIMFFFALGTLPSLITIGITSNELVRRSHYSQIFLKVAGVLVMFFAFFNINAQLNALGLTSLSNLSLKAVSENAVSEEGFAPIAKGKQILKMNALASAYEPNYFKVKVGIPVRWEIADGGFSGCTNAVISKGLFEGQISLESGQTTIKEFTPKNPGRYKFSCWMGMVSGIIDVVDPSMSLDKVRDKSSGQVQIGDVKESTLEVSSGAGGCGCGGGL